MSRHRTRAALTAVLPALLLACGQSATSFDDLGPYAGGASHPWSSTRAPGAVTPLTLDPGRNNLYYEPILSATNGWGPVEINRSNGEQQRGDGRKLSVGGRTYDVGYGVHADSELRWSLKSTIANVSCSKLDGYVGVDDEVGDRGSVIFQIFLDGTRVWDSGVTTGKDAAKFYSVDLRGRTDLRMVVTNGGDNLYYDHADWLQPTVHCEGPAAPPSLPSGTVDRTFTTVRPDFTVVDSAVQADGKVVLFGLEPDEPGVEGYVVARYNADGTKDAAFGTDGRFVQETGTGNRAVDVTIAPDGAIVALGRSGFPKPVPGTTDQNATIVLRLLPDGTPDPAWKLPDGRAGAVTAANLPEDPRGVTVQP
ncbi:NPCBM/NEW2 domain-containing protein, partial [Deinococcus pimensis]|uniref:NPCBM/NEW2 domain-containing protein n=1 Tax=Deinococcus pimensis TaxID=309888 RepID=UPI0006944A7E